MYQALYRACRPEVFDEILGQEHIVKILKNQLKDDITSHAYLFCGTRGTGKTTTARILAKGLNCTNRREDGSPCGCCDNCKAIKEGSFIDVIEIDAASNNGVDNIRELRESVNYPPQVGRKKVYIIDEVHMLSSGAFNALLKTLEEPPENVCFILATTESQKLPATILSRCMRLDFKRVPASIILDGMRKIAKERGVNITEPALKLLSNLADGSVRDGLSVLEQVLASGNKEITRDDVLESIGAVSEDFYIELTELVQLKKVSEALILLDKEIREGKDVKQIMKDWLSHYRNLLITKFIKTPEDLLNLSTENVEKIREQSQHISVNEINNAIVKLSKTINDSRYSTQSRILLELCICVIAETLDEKKVELPIKEVKFEPPITKVQEEIKISEKKKVKEEIEKVNTELDSIWDEVCKRAEDGRGSFGLVTKGTKLKRIDESTFLVIANSQFTKTVTEQRSKIAESIMTEKIGRPLRMIVDVGHVVEETSSAEESAEIGSKALGINIEVE